MNLKREAQSLESIVTSPQWTFFVKVRKPISLLNPFLIPTIAEREILVVPFPSQHAATPTMRNGFNNEMGVLTFTKKVHCRLVTILSNESLSLQIHSKLLGPQRQEPV
jgi:hypothetical protein